MHRLREFNFWLLDDPLPEQKYIYFHNTIDANSEDKRVELHLVQKALIVAHILHRVLILPLVCYTSPLTLTLALPPTPAHPCLLLLTHSRSHPHTLYHFLHSLPPTPTLIHSRAHLPFTLTLLPFKLVFNGTLRTPEMVLKMEPLYLNFEYGTDFVQNSFLISSRKYLRSSGKLTHPPKYGIQAFPYLASLAC